MNHQCGSNITVVVLATLVLLGNSTGPLDPPVSRNPAWTHELEPALFAQSVDEALPEIQAADQAAIQEMLDAQVEGWNQGDIETFMAGYWKSSKLTFASGGKLTRGWQQTHDRYVDRYSPPDQMGHLWFDHLEFQSLADSAALVLGQWHLKDQNGKVAEGNFTLLLKQFKSGWKIVHDHTSLIVAEAGEYEAGEHEADK